MINCNSLCTTLQPCSFHRGYADGRQGKNQDDSSRYNTNYDYIEGWKEGMKALEEAQNGSAW